MTHAEAREVIDHPGVTQIRTNRLQIAHVRFDQCHSVGWTVVEVFTSSVCKIVDDDHSLASRSELAHDLGADEPGASRDDDRRSPARHRFRMNRAGTPATMENGFTSCVTTAPAPTMAPRPTVTPGRMTALVPTSAHASMRTGRMSRSVWMIGTPIGSAVCTEPSTFAPGPHPTYCSITRSRASK